MSSDFEYLFPIVCIGLVLVAVLWVILAMQFKGSGKRYIGIAGVIITAFIAAGIWAPALLPWVWSIPQITVKLWLTSVVVIGFSTGVAFSYPVPWKWPIIACGLICVGLNAWAGIVFL